MVHFKESIVTIHTRHGLDFDDLYKMVRGKVNITKCPCCDSNGIQYWDGETGEGVKDNPSGINPEWLERGPCENCHGLGFLLSYGAKL